MEKPYWVLLFIGSTLAGVLAGSLISFSWGESIFIALLAVGSAGYLWMRKVALSVLVIMLVVTIGFFGGLARVAWSLQEPAQSVLDQYVGESVELKGVIVEEPRATQTGGQLVVEVADEIGATTKALVRVRDPDMANYGDQVEIIGTLARPEAFVGDTGRAFNYPMFLAKDGVYYTVDFAQVSVLAMGKASYVKTNLFTLKQRFVESLQRVLPEPEVALAGGILLGIQESLGESLEGAFRTTGVIHIVVLSGFNITIIALFVRQVCEWFRVRYPLWWSALLIVLFVIMVGAGATVVRAAIMGLLASLALVSGRTYQITYALMIAGFGMLMWNPLLLLYDPSFQLSFVATLGLIHFAPLVERHLTWIPNLLSIRTFAAATIGTQLAILPLLLFMIGELSLVAVPANMLVLVAVPWAMLAAFLAGLVGFVGVGLATPFSVLAYWLLTYMIRVVEGLAGLPWASVMVPAFPVWVMLLAYLVMIVGYVRVKAGAFGARSLTP